MNSFSNGFKRLGTDSYEQLQLSYALSQQGRFDEAISELVDVWQRKESLGHKMLIYVHLALGNIYWLQKRYDESLEHFQALSALDPLISLGYVKVGNVFLGMGRFDEAVEQFEMGLNVNPKSVPAHLGLSQIFMKRCKYEIAIGYVHQALSLDSEAIFAYILLAETHKKQGNYKNAVEVLETALEMEPEMLQAYIRLGNIYLIQNEYELAKQSFLTALDLNPLSIDAYLGLADALIAMSYLRDSIDLVEELPTICKQAVGRVPKSGLELALASQSNRFDASSHLDLWLYSFALAEQEQFLVA